MSMDLDRAMDYLAFVHERHHIWNLRQKGAPQPWTEDPILRAYKFTNVFRVLDYGSQFLLRELLEPDLSPRDILARCFLYRYTNLPATWVYFREELGRYPMADDLNETLCDLFAARMAAGVLSYSSAYIIHPMNTVGEGPKFNLIVKVAQGMFGRGSSLTARFLAADSQRERYELLRAPRGVGEFMAMQILTDWGYSTQCGVDRENEFVVAGPGAIRGAKTLGADNSPLGWIEWAYAALRRDPRTPYIRVGDSHRGPSLMDVQNTFCEFSKYVRYEANPQRTQPYAPVHPGPETIVLPEHW